MRRIVLPLIIITTLLILMNWFIYSMATQSFVGSSTWLAFIIGLGVALMPISMLLTMTRFRKKLRFVTLSGYIWMGVFTIAFFFAFVQFIFSLLSVPIHSSWVLYATLVISLWALRINFKTPKLVTHKIKGPEFLKGLRLLQISDLHIGMPTLRQSWLDRVVDKIHLADPHYVVVTGDLVDAPFEEASPLLDPLARIKVTKFYVTGNHEYIRGGDWEKRLIELGFSALHNSHEIVSHKNGDLLIAGVPDRRVSGFNRSLESNPDLALTTSRSVDYKILLAHQPGSVFDLKHQTCDLVLSGHTHGGQIFPFGILARFANPVIKGFKTINGIKVFAHQGTGFWGPPMRWFTRCEIVVFEWH